MSSKLFAPSLGALGSVPTESHRGDELDAPHLQCPPASVLMADRELKHARNKSFQSGHQWDQVMLRQVLTHELEDICAKGMRKMARLRQQQRERGYYAYQQGTSSGTGFTLPSSSLLHPHPQSAACPHDPSVHSAQYNSLVEWLKDGSKGAVSNGSSPNQSKCTSLSSSASASCLAGPASAKVVEEQLISFNSSVSNPFQLLAYVERMVSCADCSPASFIIMLVYIDRMHERHRWFQLTDVNVHLVSLAALLAPIKYLDDAVYSNAHYAAVGGISPAKMNELEGKFNSALDWELFVDPEVFRIYESGPLGRWTRLSADGERVVIPPIQHSWGWVLWVHAENVSMNRKSFPVQNWSGYGAGNGRECGLRWRWRLHIISTTQGYWWFDVEDNYLIWIVPCSCYITLAEGC